MGFIRKELINREKVSPSPNRTNEISFVHFLEKSITTNHSRVANFRCNHDDKPRQEQASHNRPVYRSIIHERKQPPRFPGKIQSFSLKRRFVTNSNSRDNQGDNHGQPISLISTRIEDLRGVKKSRRN